MKDIITNTDPTLSRKEFYAELLEQVKCICEDQSFWVTWVLENKLFCNFFDTSNQVTNLSNASTVIYHGLISLEHFQSKPINWCGFYITDPKNDQQLILGPFQGKVSVLLECVLIMEGLDWCWVGRVYCHSFR